MIQCPMCGNEYVELMGMMGKRHGGFNCRACGFVWSQEFESLEDMEPEAEEVEEEQ